MIDAPKTCVSHNRQSCYNGSVAVLVVAPRPNVLLGIVILTIAVGWLPSVVMAGQSPIYMTFDLHVDPVTNGFPISAKRNVYEERTDNMAWVLDQTVCLEIPISFLSKL